MKILTKMATMMTMIKKTTIKAMKHIFFPHLLHFFGIGATIHTPWEDLVLKQCFSKKGKVHKQIKVKN